MNNRKAVWEQVGGLSLYKSFTDEPEFCIFRHVFLLAKKTEK